MKRLTQFEAKDGRTIERARLLKAAQHARYRRGMITEKQANKTKG